ncbi:hypothetical protein [Massilia aerilata]|uniref:Uncharacterized protein n=1 Tax=Massilia aerilata TaxID=453817 RepID=A0ABW0S452_9BURK
MDRINVAIVAPLVARATILARIDVLEQETSAALLRGVASAAEYRTINNILATQHAQARAFAEPPTRP